MRDAAPHAAARGLPGTSAARRPTALPPGHVVPDVVHSTRRADRRAPARFAGKINQGESSPGHARPADEMSGHHPVPRGGHNGPAPELGRLLRRQTGGPQATWSAVPRLGDMMALRRLTIGPGLGRGVRRRGVPRPRPRSGTSRERRPRWPQGSLPPPVLPRAPTPGRLHAGRARREKKRGSPESPFARPNPGAAETTAASRRR